MNRKQMLARLKNGEDPLELSIEKWQDLANRKIRTTRGIDSQNCALCHLHALDDCNGCLVSEKMGKRGCIDTPYFDYANAVWCGVDSLAKIREIALKEVEFLKSLRKEVEK